MADQTDDGTLAFADLRPDDVAAALDGLGLECDGRLLALNSYENRVYRAGVADGDFVVAKFYRPGRWSDDAIVEEHTFSEQLAAREVPVVAPLRIDGQTLHRQGPFRLSVSPNRPGRAPELDDDHFLEQIGRLVARLHLCGELDAFQHRPALTVDRLGQDSADFLLDGGFLPADIESVYEGLVYHALDAVDTCFERAGAVQTLRLHGDLHAGNVLVDDERIHIVDIDDAQTGPAVQDLWMFLSGERDDQERQLQSLLKGYGQFRRFDAQELNIVEALRTLRIIHYAAWIARRWADPAFRMAFPWFENRRYWDDQVLSLREQLALMTEPPLAWDPG